MQKVINAKNLRVEIKSQVWAGGQLHRVCFALSVWKVLKKAIAKMNIDGENFHNSSKICKNCKTFLSLNFCRLR